MAEANYHNTLLSTKIFQIAVIDPSSFVCPGAEKMIRLSGLKSETEHRKERSL